MRIRPAPNPQPATHTLAAVLELPGQVVERTLLAQTPTYAASRLCFSPQTAGGCHAPVNTVPLRFLVL